MLSQLLFEEPLPLDQEAIITRENSTTWRELQSQAQSFVDEHRGVGKRRVGLPFSANTASCAALGALERLESDVFLFNPRLADEETLTLASKLKLGAFLQSEDDGKSSKFRVCELPGEEAWSGSPTVTILTSGTTGEPKAARHSWESLARPIRKGRGNSAPRWLLTYRPNLYAGLQVMLQCFSDRGVLAVPDHEMDPQTIAQFMYKTGVQFVSATPSYWRRLLMFSDAGTLRKVPLVQITLGGEVIDQPILDKLRGHFPQARLVHIYATTELGRCFSVNDGLSGFPASYLSGALQDGTELRIQQEELQVRSANSMRMYDPHSSQMGTAMDWFATGDLVEIRNDRVYFAGRKSDMINVAGSKVYPVEVERVIRVIPGVADVRVFGKTSSIAGELVVCEIVPNLDQDREMLKESVARVCREKLTTYQQPRMIKFVERLSLSSAGKTVRTPTA
jgi:acyl-CoA synthetase (AMP-forming)/AMP-acid ligase II